MRRGPLRRLAGLALAAVPGLAAVLTGGGAAAQIAISANDNKVTLVNGVATVVDHPAPDTITIIDLGGSPPRVVAEIPVPTSVAGPPVSVAITADERLALVTAATKIDPADHTKQVPDNRVSVVDLHAHPPRVIATHQAGAGAAGVSINRQGTLALVANRSDGTVSVFGIDGQTLRPMGAVAVGPPRSGPSHVVFAPDGNRALVTRAGDSYVSLLAVEGTTVRHTARDLSAGLGPSGVDVSRDGSIAVVGNAGRGSGDSDTISLIDLEADPPRVVQTVTVGQTPEGVTLSPDGTLAAIVIMNGSDKAARTPFYSDAGQLLLYRIEGKRLVPAAAAWIGRWPQGAAFSADSRTIVVGNMVERNVQVLRWDGTALRDEGERIGVNGGSAALRTASKP